MIELYHGGAAGHSAAVQIALAEKSLPYASHALDLARFEQHAPAFLAINPAGQVPVLRADGHTLTEAFFILLYLDERHPDPPLCGSDPRARYAVQKWGKYVETHIAPNLAILGWAAAAVEVDAATRAGFERLPPARRALWSRAADGFDTGDCDAARAALVTAGARVAEALATGDWLAGPAWTLADIIVFPHLARFASLGIALPDTVTDWIDRAARRPAVVRALGPHGIATTPATMGPERGRWG